MKFVAFIMAFLIPLLGMMPCADLGGVMQANSSKTEITKTSRACNDALADDCSPFCNCACCASYSIHHYTMPVISLPLFSDKTSSIFLPSEPADAAFVFWHPPRSC